MSLHPALFEFLKAVREHNSRKYFASIRPLYDDILANIYEFITELTNELSKYDDVFTQVEPKKAMFRIYRDARRLKEGDYLYKYNWGMVLNPDGRQDPKAYPYLHFSPGNSVFSGGIYWGDHDLITQIRRHLLTHYEDYLRLTSDPEFLKRFGRVYGQRLTTLPRGFSKNTEYPELIKAKQWLISHHYTDKQVLSASFMQQIIKDYLVAREFFDFFNNIIE